MIKIIFYFPYKEECGVPILFLRMSRWIAHNYSDKFDVYVGDYVDGAMARNLTSKDKVKLVVSGTKEGIIINNNDILVMQSLNPYYFPKELHLAPKAKLFFWTLHFRNLTPSLLPFPGLRDLPYNHLFLYKFCSLFYRSLIDGICKLIENMTIHHAHYYMDISTRHQTELHIPINRSFDLDYLPVPASDYNGVLKCKKEEFNTINACWIGRISFEKTPILIHTLKKCSSYALEHQQKIHFYVMGDGEFVDLVDDLSVENNYFTKTKCAPIKFSEIDSFLLKNVDIMFAMGTSALEAAKLGIPTVLVDCTATQKSIDGDYIFKYIYERIGYDLGHIITPADIKDGNDSLDRIFKELVNNYNFNAEKSREYFVKNHSLSSIGEKFYNIIQKLSFSFDMIDPKVIEQPKLLNIYNKLRDLNRFK